MNWQEIINALEQAGLTQVEMAQALDCSQGYISDLKTGRRGKRVDYFFGEKLLALYKLKCPQVANG